MEFFWLMFAHFLGDMPLQGEWLAKEKGKEPLFMLGHVTIWTGCVALALQMLGIEMSMWKWIFLFGGHYLLDWTKCKLFSIPLCLNAKSKRFLVYVDQVLHLIQLLVVYLL